MLAIDAKLDGSFKLHELQAFEETNRPDVIRRRFAEHVKNLIPVSKLLRMS